MPLPRILDCHLTVIGFTPDSDSRLDGGVVTVLIDGTLVTAYVMLGDKSDLWLGWAAIHLTLLRGVPTSAKVAILRQIPEADVLAIGAQARRVIDSRAALAADPSAAE